MTDTQTTWARYRHRERPEIEYDVEGDGFAAPAPRTFNGETCFRIRTIKNHSHHEEAHQPAFTWMPSEFFLQLYERVTQLSWHPVVGDRVVLDGDPEECGEIIGEEMDGMEVRWDGGDYATVAVNELLPEPPAA